MDTDERESNRCLAFNYMIEARKAKGIAGPHDMVVKTIVTTELIDEIARQSGVKCYNVLTGFKYIAELINRAMIGGYNGPSPDYLPAPAEERVGRAMIGSFTGSTSGSLRTD